MGFADPPLLNVVGVHRVPFSGYLFYKWSGRLGQDADDWGEALTPEQQVAQAGGWSRAGVAAP